ncbi:MAG: hypothetical protein M3O84_04510 [Actinomycetota bacterium]|nr:hypothetical protein [Actinomycetota bacterium]
MVETINPVVYGGPRSRWRTGLAIHVLGATLAATAFGGALGLAGGLLRAPWGSAAPLIVGGLAALYLLREVFRIPVPVLEARRQVPDWWRTFFSRNVTAFLYGSGVGIGFLTYLGHGTLLVVSAAAFASERPLVGAVLVGPFGLSRGLAIVVARRTEDPSLLVDALASFARRGWPRVAHAAALAVVVAAAALSTERISHLNASEVAAAALAVAFAWAASAKLVRPSSWRRSLAGYGLPTLAERGAVFAVPLLEGAVAALAVAGLERAAGVTAAVLLLGFSFAILRARSRSGNRLPCGCFGGARMRDYRAMLARNAVLELVAVLVALTGADALRSRLVSMPGDSDLLPAALAISCTIMAAWTLGRGLTLLRRVD